MSRHKIERRYRKMQADAKAFGAELRLRVVRRPYRRPEIQGL